MERLTIALSEISTALEEHGWLNEGSLRTAIWKRYLYHYSSMDVPEMKREKEEAQRRELQLQSLLQEERDASNARESALLEANNKLMDRVEELTATVARLQAQVMELTRAQNMHLTSILASSSASSLSSTAPAQYGTSSISNSALLRKPRSPVSAPTTTANPSTNVSVPPSSSASLSTVIPTDSTTISSNTNPPTTTINLENDLEGFRHRLRNRLRTEVNSNSNLPTENNGVSTVLSSLPPSPAIMDDSKLVVPKSTVTDDADQALSNAAKMVAKKHAHLLAAVTPPPLPLNQPYENDTLPILQFTSSNNTNTNQRPSLDNDYDTMRLSPLPSTQDDANDTLTNTYPLSGSTYASPYNKNSAQQQPSSYSMMDDNEKDEMEAAMYAVGMIPGTVYNNNDDGTTNNTGNSSNPRMDASVNGVNTTKKPNNGSTTINKSANNRTNLSNPTASNRGSGNSNGTVIGRTAIVKSTNSYAAAVIRPTNATDLGSMSHAAAMASANAVSRSLTPNTLTNITLSNKSTLNSNNLGGAKGGIPNTNVLPSVNSVGSNQSTFPQHRKSSPRDSTTHSSSSSHSLLSSSAVADIPLSKPDLRAGPYDDIDGQGTMGRLGYSNDTLRTTDKSINNDNGSSNNPTKGTTTQLPPASTVRSQSTASSISSSSSSSSTANLTAPQFFALLQAQVSASNLESLMAALAVFNKGSIGRNELLAIAERTLQPDILKCTKNNQVPNQELLSTFKALILRVQ